MGESKIPGERADFGQAIHAVELLMSAAHVHFLGTCAILCSLQRNAKWTGWERERKAKEKLSRVNPFPLTQKDSRSRRG